MLIVTDVRLPRRLHYPGNRGTPILVNYKDGRQRFGSLAEWCREYTSGDLYSVRSTLTNQTVDIFGIYQHSGYKSNQHKLSRYQPALSNNCFLSPDTRCERFSAFMLEVIESIFDHTPILSLSPYFQWLAHINKQVFPGTLDIIEPQIYYGKRSIGALLNIPGTWLQTVPIISFLLLLPRAWYHIGQSNYISYAPAFRNKTPLKDTWTVSYTTELMRWIGWGSLLLPNVPTISFWTFIYCLLEIADGKLSPECLHAPCSGFNTWLCDFIYKYPKNNVAIFYDYIKETGLEGFITYPGG